MFHGSVFFLFGHGDNFRCRNLQFRQKRAWNYICEIKIEDLLAPYDNGALTVVVFVSAQI